MHRSGRRGKARWNDGIGRWGRALALGVCLSGCDAGGPGAVTIVLVDLSGSLPAPTLEFYGEAIAGSVWSELGQSDQMIVMPIDAAAEQRAEVVFSSDLRAEDFYRDDDGVARREEREQERVAEFKEAEAMRLREALAAATRDRAGLRSGTDILGALHAAAGRFPGSDGRRRILVVFSDMIQESAELDLRGLARTGAEGAQVEFEGLSAAGRIPDLLGTQVLAVGAGETGAATGTDDPAYFRAVRGFWQQLFEAAGASLDAERHYGYRTQDLFVELLHGASLEP